MPHTQIIPGVLFLIYYQSFEGTSLLRAHSSPKNNHLGKFQNMGEKGLCLVLTCFTPCRSLFYPGTAQWFNSQLPFSEIVWFQKISMPTTRRVNGNSEGEFSVKGKYQPKLEFPDWEIQTEKKPSLRGVRIFSGPTYFGLLWELLHKGLGCTQ